MPMKKLTMEYGVVPDDAQNGKALGEIIPRY